MNLADDALLAHKIVEHHLCRSAAMPATEPVAVYELETVKNALAQKSTEEPKTGQKAYDVSTLVLESAHRKSTKNIYGSKYISANRPRLTEDEILQWADAHFERNGYSSLLQWPNNHSGLVQGADASPPTFARPRSRRNKS